MKLPALRPAATSRPMARRVGASGAVAARRKGPRFLWLGLGVGVGIVALIGILRPLSAAGAGSDTPSSTSGSALSGGLIPSLGGMDLLDLAAKCAVVLALLYIVLRVLGKLQSPARKTGSLLEVLESRPLAAKASLHLVAVGNRRLVVGLTPSGMVSLAELDAAELTSAQKTAALEAAAADHAAAKGDMAPGMPGLPRPISLLGPLTGPIDALTGRLATLVSGGRVR